MNRENHVKCGELSSFNVKAIWLDGVRQDGVIEFNISERWLVRYIMPMKVVDGEVQTERLTGNISIDWKE